MRPLGARRLAWLACAGLVLPAIALAQAEVPVLFRVRVVHAAAQEGKFDPGCEDTRRFMKPMNFGSMRLMQDRQLRLVMGQTGEIALPNGERVRLLPISIVQRRLHVHLQGPSINGRVQMVPGKPVILGPQRHRDGRLIIQIDPEF